MVGTIFKGEIFDTNEIYQIKTKMKSIAQNNNLPDVNCRRVGVNSGEWVLICL